MRAISDHVELLVFSAFFGQVPLHWFIFKVLILTEFWILPFFWYCVGRVWGSVLCCFFQKTSRLFLLRTTWFRRFAAVPLSSYVSFGAPGFVFTEALRSVYGLCSGIPCDWSLCEPLFSLGPLASFVLFSSPVAVIKSAGKSNLKEKGFVLAHGQRVQSIELGKTWQRSYR